MLRTLIIAATLALSLPAISTAAEPAETSPTRKADLADRVAGTYKGAVISDARGSSRDNVTITVTRVGLNKVEITSDYPRIPTVTIPVEKAMDAILAASGPYVFLLDTVRAPDRLDLSIDDASWYGTRIANPAAK
ncbi:MULTISPECIES: hypothetical protein [unclassified Sphingopyxis]|uniref:hypothetical protein n=1 Tax=unclassified Sphingopyxis TaxID=2614943 RepID=UPI0028602838|nr:MULTISPECIES: hypothetical protein [unclassified Sphingopyxis]MDR6832829.1 hypothetical protein [Sphingopyxis sp. BE122]MDR7228572.1 hypothetical protein [Sphingopyxis sp. BE259]